MVLVQMVTGSWQVPWQQQVTQPGGKAFVCGVQCFFLFKGFVCLKDLFV